MNCSQDRGFDESNVVATANVLSDFERTVELDIFKTAFDENIARAAAGDKTVHFGSKAEMIDQYWTNLFAEFENSSPRIRRA